MKKITLLLMAVLAWVGTVSAQDAQSAVTFNWAHSVEGGAGANICGSTMSTDGSYYIATTFATKANNVKVSFDGVVMEGIEGSAHASNNNNLMLQKVGKDGTIAWSLYTKKGDVSSINLASTSDGGVIAVVKSRAWDAAEGLTNLLEVIDAKGASTIINDPETTSGEYRFSVLKITADGTVAWNRIISGQVKEYSGKFTTDNAYVNSCVVDADDNIYLGGNFRTTLVFAKVDNTTVTLAAKNTPDSYFNTQNSVGDLFLAKLDKDGYYVNSIVGEGTCAMAYIDKMIEKNGKLYVDGRVQGEGYTLGGKDILANASYQTPYVAALSTSDFAVDYVNTFAVTANSASRFVIQNKAMDMVGDNLYLTGALNGGLAADGITVNTEATQLKGYLIKVDATTGKVLSMVVNNEGISSYQGVYNGDKTIYAYGYVMVGGVGTAYLFPFAKDKMVLQTQILLTTAGSDVAPLLADGNQLILMSRGRKATHTFTGTDKTFTFGAFAAAYYSYSINDVPTAIKNISSSVNASDKVDVYSLNGIRVKQNVSVAEATQGLAKGIYVVGGKKVVVK